MDSRRAEDHRLETEDLECLRRMASRDPAALDELYERYNRLAFSLILRIIGNRADAEDVLVDTFWQVWQQAGRYQASRGKPVAWLLTIARTRAIDALRSTNRQQSRTEELEPQDAPPAAAVMPEDPAILGMRHSVRTALSGLNDSQRTVLELAYFQGMSHSEIATATGQPLGTVKDRIRTGMLHLKKALQAYV